MTRRLALQQLLKPRRPAPERVPTDLAAIKIAVEPHNRWTEAMNLYTSTLESGRIDLDRWKRAVELKQQADRAWERLTRG